jgi:hypothetical protein
MPEGQTGGAGLIFFVRRDHDRRANGSDERLTPTRVELGSDQ